MNLDDLLTPEEASTQIFRGHIKAATIRFWQSRGRLKRIKVGKRTFVSRQDLSDLADTSTAAAGSQEAYAPVAAVA